MLVKKFKILIFCWIIPFMFYGQFEFGGKPDSLKPKTDTTKVKTQVIKVFDNTTSSGLAESRPAVRPRKNALKLGAAAIASGDFSIYYERVLNRIMSIEIGQGVTYTDWVFNALSPEMGNSNTNDKDAQAVMGYTAKIGLRYYRNGDYDMDGLYFGPEFWYRDYKLNVPEKNSQAMNTGTYLPDERRYTDIKCVLGYNNLEWIDNLIFDFYVGIGIRSTNWSHINTRFDYSNLTGYTYYTNREELNIKSPSFSLGFKLGFSF